ncbi:hypothetical protein LZ32DRAFT_658070 [Colletotrichum eremochloae]|nr:hypothetical protein LZ32DRAFT_658070 [Colletotrichum eremochloae]
MVTYSFAQDPDIDLILLSENVDPGDDGLGTIEYGFSDCDSESLASDASDARSIDTSIFEGIHVNDSSSATHPPTTAPDKAATTPRSASSAMQPVVRFKVSLAILRETSPVVRELLNSQMGNPRADTARPGVPCIPIHEDNPVAMALVLRKVHGVETYEDMRHPFLLTYEDADQACLADMATIIEKYRLHSYVENGMKECIERLWKKFDESSTGDALVWTWISWAFDLTDHFTEATMRLAKNAKNSFGKREASSYLLPRQILGRC